MKFNSVEISGFRIYDRPEDANFSFVTDDGETADFVSLYAPNGFGKTSFYDAVEWAVTDYVGRFWVTKNTEKSLRTMRRLTSGQISLFKNRNSTNETWVKIFDSDNNLYKVNRLEVAKQRANDANLNSKDDKNFARVILSQEWIARFLKEADGQIRYKKFMESNPGLSEVDLYYQNVIALSGANDKKIAVLKNNIKDFKDRITETSEKDLLATVNNQIAVVNKFDFNEKLDNIEITTTKKQVTEFRDALTDRITDDSEFKKLKKLLSHIRLAQNGNSDFLSRKQYFKAIEHLANMVKQKTVINENLRDFKKLEATTNEIKQSEKSNAEILTRLKALETIQNLIPAYNFILVKITSKNKLKNEHQDKLKKLQTDIEESNRKLIEIESANKKCERQRLKINEQLSKIPELKNNLEALLKSIKSLKEKIESQRNKVSKSQTAYSKLKDEVDELKKVIYEFDLGQYSETSLGKNQEQINNLKQIETLEAQRLGLKKELESIQELIDSQESLNKSLNEFIASGLNIVNQKETDTCPLCEHTYDNYQALADRILNNNALSTSIKTSLDEHLKKQSEISYNERTADKLSDNIKQFYANKLDDLQNRLKIAEETKESEQRVLDDLTKQLIEENEKLLDLKSNFQDESIDAYEKKLRAEIEVIQTSKQSGKEQIKKTEEAHQKLESEKIELSEKIGLLDSEINDLVNDKDYSDVVQWLDINNQGDEQIVDFVNAKIQKIKDESKELDKALSNLKSELKALNEKLKKHNEKQLKENLNEVEKKLKDLESSIATYKTHLEDNLLIKASSLTNETLNSSLKTKEIETKEKINRHEQYVIEVNKLKGYSENILPYLQSEQAKLDLVNTQKELKFLYDNVRKSLDAEIEKTKNHLDQRIKDFFYEDLINEIYGKIDPHPTFKNVKFIATFSGDSPSLDVYVKGGTEENDENSLIPNLYFSTAQINILSLSIFLASALNSRTYDCIFIDDPIQSMDSINVLSTIDLLRSIIVNNKKQIILSTHDENFHNLLKMKIPSKLFKSKFLELESFGKLSKEKLLNI
ncbi:MAG: hypothetical protein CMC05_12635 [Flavobacteriaceae bacterium]|nr:hypothetical protein [Flavobacteriaceae bacterium]MBD10604.1 hypothetical protein [Flavobacteriaceae bacterium]|tara:strand:- start:222 stop:3359 length:3138 start_codon:yes stop_codon:yes gene_type:complete